MYKEYEFITNIINQMQLFKLKLLGAKIGKNVKVVGKFKVAGHPKRLEVGNNVMINEGVFLNCRDELIIKNNVRLSAYCRIFTAQLELENYPRKHIQSPVIIEKNAWIATGAVVLPGVIIGENCVIGENSVNRSTEKNSLYAENSVKK